VPGPGTGIRGDLARVQNYPSGACANFSAHCHTFNNNPASNSRTNAGKLRFLNHVLFVGERIFFGLNRFWASLHDIELLGFAVQRPLHVHRLAVVFLDDHGPTGQLHCLFVRNRKAVAVAL
jgi:hypothetical protein